MAEAIPTHEANLTQTTWHLVAHHKEIPEGMCLQLGVAGHSILLCKVQGTIHCIEDRCSHRDIPLNQGWLEGYEMVCPLHGATFDIRTGHPCRLPAKMAISSYSVRLDEQQRVFVALPHTP